MVSSKIEHTDINGISNTTILDTPYSIPRDWRWVRLGEVCKINPPKPRNFTRSIDAFTTFIPMAAVDETTGTIINAEVVPYSKVFKGYTYFQENDVLFAKITPCMQNGKHVIAKDLIDGIGFGTTEFHVIRPNDNVLSEWVHYFIRQRYFLEEAIAYFTGAVGQQRVPKSFLSDYLIPLPPIEEQKKIIDKIRYQMQDIEHAKIACEKTLKATNALPYAYLREVFESDEAKEWERRRLSEVIETIESGSRPKGGVFDIKEGIPSIGAEHINSFGRFNFNNVRFVPKEFYKSMKRGKTQKSDVLVVKDGATTGRVCYIDDIFPFSESAVNEHVFRLRSKPLLNQYFLFLFFYSSVGQREIQDEFHGSAQGGINQKFLEGIIISFPSLSDHQRIANELKEKMVETEKLQSAIQNQQSTIDALPQAILRKAFRGEL